MWDTADRKACILCLRRGTLLIAMVEVDELLEPTVLILVSVVLVVPLVLAVVLGRTEGPDMIWYARGNVTGRFEILVWEPPRTRAAFVVL